MTEIKSVRCINCNKKLAESLKEIKAASTAMSQGDMTIKCPRCNVITAVHLTLTP